MKESAQAELETFIPPPSALIPFLWRKVWESNPQERSSSDSFRDCSACQCPTFLKLAGAPGFKPRKAGLESASLALSLRPPRSASGRSRTSTPVSGPQLYGLLPSLFGL